MVLNVAEPHGTQRPVLVVLEGGMDAGMKVMMRRAGDHFENLDTSGEGRARLECIRSNVAICLLTLCERGLVYIVAPCGSFSERLPMR
jgi:hypothetical protein